MGMGLHMKMLTTVKKGYAATARKGCIFTTKIASRFKSSRGNADAFYLNRAPDIKKLQMSWYFPWCNDKASFTSPLMAARRLIILYQLTVVLYMSHKTRVIRHLAETFRYIKLKHLSLPTLLFQNTDTAQISTRRCCIPNFMTLGQKLQIWPL